MYVKNLQCQILRGDSDQKGLVSFVASTANEDRYGDIINQKGWDLSKFRANPVILLNHNANALPIGKGEVEVIDGRLMVDVEFDMGDPQAAEVARKTKAGFLNAVSVGFNPLDATPRSMLEKSHPAHGQSGQYFDRAELLEVSIVTIPANGDAVAAKSLNLDIETIIREYIASFVDKTMQGQIKQVSKDTIEIAAPDGHHWMDYEGGPVLMVGEDADHEGASSTFRFEIIEEHDPSRLKADTMGDMDEEEEMEQDAMKPKDDDDEEKYHDEDSEDDKEKNFLTPQERDFLRSLLNGDNQ